VEPEATAPHGDAEDRLGDGLPATGGEIAVGAEKPVEDPLGGGAGEHLAEWRLQRGGEPCERIPGEGAQAGDGAGERGYFATSTQRKPRKSPSW
jgi:hypothetical protein